MTDEYKLLIEKGQGGEITYSESYNGKDVKATPNPIMDNLVDRLALADYIAIVSNPSSGVNQLELTIKLSGGDLK